MLLRKKDDFDVDKFWKDYETSIGEKVLAKSLGQYLSGWAEYAQPMWGLAIATSGGFRFHHFPHEGWIMALSRISRGGEVPREKTFSIPRECINSAELVVEKHWLKKLFSSPNPLLIIHCRINGVETDVMVETDKSAEAVVEALAPTAV